MSEDCEVIIDEKDKTADIILKTAVRTLFYLFISSAVLLAFISQRYPLKACGFFRDLGLYGDAFGYARHAYDLDNDSLPATINCVELSSILLDDATGYKKAEKHAKNLVFFTQKYVENKGCDAQNKRMDDFYYNSASSTAELIDLYSYADYISCENFRARTVLSLTDGGQLSRMLLGKNLILLSDVALTLKDMDLKNTASVFYMIDAYSTESLRYVFYGESYNEAAQRTDILYDNGETDLFTALASRAADFVPEAYQLSLSLNDDTRLRGLYYLKAAYDLYFALSAARPDGKPTESIENAFILDEGERLHDYLLNKLYR